MIRLIRINEYTYFVERSIKSWEEVELIQVQATNKLSRLQSNISKIEYGRNELMLLNFKLLRGFIINMSGTLYSYVSR